MNVCDSSSHISAFSHLDSKPKQLENTSLAQSLMQYMPQLSSVPTLQPKPSMMHNPSLNHPSLPLRTYGNNTSVSRKANLGVSKETRASHAKSYTLAGSTRSFSTV